jgi:hypothetical protein
LAPQLPFPATALAVRRRFARPRLVVRCTGKVIIVILQEGFSVKFIKPNILAASCLAAIGVLPQSSHLLL